MPDLIPVDHDPFADATGFFPAFDAAGTRIPMDVDPSTGVPILSSVSQAPMAIQKLFGAPGVERYQTWPEKMIRSAVTLPADAYAGKVPVETRAGFPGAEPEGSRDVLMEPNLLGKALGMSAKWNVPSPEGEIGRTQDLAGLAVTGPLAAAKGSATLGSGMTRPNEPYLVPAIKLNGKVYKGKSSRDEHMDVAYDHGLVPDHVNGADDFVNWADSLPNDKHNDWGFVNNKGHFLSRNKAGEYAADHGLVGPEHVEDARNGIFTADMLLSDTGKPGSAVSALAHSQQAPAFYSAVEHAINNVRNDKMSPDQWVGYLKNQPGVKAEELAWMGLNDLKSFGAGKKQLTKQEVLDHAKEHGVEIKEVNKSGETWSEPQLREGLDAVLEQEFERFAEEHNRNPTDHEYHQIVADTEQNFRANPAEYADYLPTEGAGPKFSEYQLPGGENYREMLFTLPEKTGELPKGWKVEPHDLSQYGHPKGTIQYRVMDDKGKQVGPNYDTPERATAEHVKRAENYISSHWDGEPNVLAHVRMNDREIPEVGKALHLEELQSDWHQQGRKQGYNIPDDPSKWTAKRNGDNWIVYDAQGREMRRSFAPTAEEAIKRSQEDVGNNATPRGVPDAPFKTTWPDLVLKRMIREASEKGYDAISWTPGEAQAARYDLSKQVNSIGATNNGNGTFHLEGFLPNGGVKVWNSVPEAKIADYVGKDLADKIVKQKEKSKEYSGLDLKVGGEGMKAFYDKMLVDKANAIAKKFGGKVEKQGVPDMKEQGTYAPFEVPGHGFFGDRVSAVNYAKARGLEPEVVKEHEIPKHTLQIHVLRLPQQLRDVATKRGFPLFAAGLPFSFTPVDHDPFQETK